MPSSGMLHCVVVVRTDILEKRSASIMRVTRSDKLEATLAVVLQSLVTANIVPGSLILVTLMMEAGATW
jgi:hypothetical protein